MVEELGSSSTEYVFHPLLAERRRPGFLETFVNFKLHLSKSNDDLMIMLDGQVNPADYSAEVDRSFLKRVFGPNKVNVEVQVHVSKLLVELTGEGFVIKQQDQLAAPPDFNTRYRRDYEIEREITRGKKRGEARVKPEGGFSLSKGIDAKLGIDVALSPEVSVTRRLTSGATFELGGCLVTPRAHPGGHGWTWHFDVGRGADPDTVGAATETELDYILQRWFEKEPLALAEMTSAQTKLTMRVKPPRSMHAVHVRVGEASFDVELGAAEKEQIRKDIETDLRAQFKNSDFILLEVAIDRAREVGK